MTRRNNNLGGMNMKRNLLIAALIGTLSVAALGVAMVKLIQSKEELRD